MSDTTVGGDAADEPTVAPVPLRRGNLFLVGLPGAGKSTLGRQLARKLGKRFVDADAELEQRLGVSITTIFEIEGESGFRDREEMVLSDLTCMANIVLSTGGGAVLRPGNRWRLRDNGTVVYLHAEPSTLYGRIRHNRNRPLLRTSDQLARLAELYAARDGLYRDTAAFIVESERGAVMRLARRFEMSNIP